MGRVVVVLGGARSGKSEVAERLVERLAGTGVVTYVATGPQPGPDDPAWAARLDAHRARRPSHWRTVEVGAELPDALGALAGPALVDSLGTWLAAAPDLRADADALVRALVERDGDTVVVSDEVGLGVVPSTAVGGVFRDALGDLNRSVADVADEVLLVVAGRVLPLARP